MTVLPTVRRQLQAAAEQQAGSRSTGPSRLRRPRDRHAEKTDNHLATGPRRRGRGVKVRPGTAVMAVSIAVSLAVALFAIALLERAQHATSQPAHQLPAQGSTGDVQRQLDGAGIGAAKFGQPPATVLATLRRLLGTPSSAGPGASTGIVPSICGFDHEIDWYGLSVKATHPRSQVKGAPTIASAANLIVYFKHSKFAGYSYFEGRALQRDIRHGTAAGPTLETARGLALGDTVARARRLYGEGFVTFEGMQGTPPNPRLARTTNWKARTAQGPVGGGIEITPPQRRVTGESTVAAISAGAIANTPCKSQPRKPS